MSRTKRRKAIAITVVVVVSAVLLLARSLDVATPSNDLVAARSDGLTVTGGGRDAVAVKDLSFIISGIMTGRLSPGATRPLDLSLRNLIPFDLSVTRLTVRIRRVDAPQADATHRCTRADFAVRQSVVSRTITLPARRTTQPSVAVNLPRARSPRVHMRNTAKNQDGCKGATLRLTYAGVADVSQP